MVFIAVVVAMVALIAFSIVKMGRFGGVSVYNILSYLIVVGLCFAFISKGVFEITLGSVFMFLAGLVLMNVMQAHIYNAIKTEFNLGKTVESSVKVGYNKSIWTVVDVYAVFVLGSLALLIGGAGVYTLALQALICVITGAFCNLLWGRFINFTFLSASKNKYKYFRFVREEDDDE
jgi:SecD/SecF fusion protein